MPPQWRSVSQEVPVETGVYYLVYVAQWEMISVAKFRGDWGSQDEDLTIEGVTHWMPLPPAPRITSAPPL